MDVCAEKRGQPDQPSDREKLFDPGHPGVRVRNVRRKFGPKILCLYCFFFPDFLTCSCTSLHLFAHFPRISMQRNVVTSKVAKMQSKVSAPPDQNIQKNGTNHPNPQPPPPFPLLPFSPPSPGKVSSLPT